MKTTSCEDGTLKNQLNFHTIPTSCAICQLCLVFVVWMRGLRRAVGEEGGGIVLGV